MKIRGRYASVHPTAPYGYLRMLTVETEHGEHELQVGFKKIEEQTKGLKKGDLIEVEYENYDNFTIRKL
jgi:hypothetical protein